jgi:hypothetical protein
MEVTTTEMCHKIEDLVMQGRCLKVSMIAQDCSVSGPSVLAIFHDCLGMSKVNSHWVPRMLNPLQKQCQVQLSEENSGLMKQFQKYF